jgi:hypothetical protein
MHRQERTILWHAALMGPQKAKAGKMRVPRERKGKVARRRADWMAAISN